ncbi:MAG: heparinase II/III family protein [Clostridia bacterium]|nr:heparinase II/III family protein [Clostridia bacterium]
MMLNPSLSYDDPTIRLRFAFTVNFDFEGDVGIVYSLHNQNPTMGGPSCMNSSGTLCSLTTYIGWYDGALSPGFGRRWAIAETFTITKAHYDDPIYIRAYAYNGSGIQYSYVLVTSVWAVFMREWNNSDAIFTSTDFGENNITSDLDAVATKHYNDPLTTPIGEHPRVLFNESDVPGIVTAFNNAPAKTKSQYDGVSERYQKVTANPPDGILSGGNYNAKTLNDIQLLALLYQMTGNQTFGYRAIYAIKNVLKTMSTNWTMGDKCRNYGHVMYVAACVYDWCHDLTTSRDRQQIVRGVQNKCCQGGRMEIDFPPQSQGAISDHGTEHQLLRDYLSFAIAIYDEYPGWWDYIAGRFYQEYVPVRNEFYKAGMVPQGVSNYLRLRFASDLYSALLIKAATGTFPYASQSNMQKVMRTVYAYELPRLSTGGELHAFASGDNQTWDKDFQDFGKDSLFASHLFNDRTARAMLKRLEWSYSAFDDHLTMRASVAEYLICSSSGVTPASSSHSGVKRIVYNGGWLGQIITRTDWQGNDIAATLMKIGCRMASGHEHADAGQFQIWYKGMLAGDTGAYDTYDRAGNVDPHFFQYHQATVAHNCIVLGNDEGQNQPPETGNFNNWMTNNIYKTGTVTGVRYGFMDADPEAPDYAYIAGDLTPAYSGTGKVSSYERRMLTVYDTADHDNEKLYFFVYDNITTMNKNYQKKFLLHVPTNPTVSGNKVTVTNAQGGRLVLQNVFGGATISKVGGVVFTDGEYNSTASSNYKVNGTQITNVAGTTTYDGFWGRVEIKTNTSSANSELLNAMYVCDANVDPNLTAQGFSSSNVKGTVLGNTAAVFVKSSAPLSYSFSVPGSGTKWFYVSGVADGNWKIKRNGTTVHESKSATGGLLIFDAQTGTIEIIKQ